MSRSIQILAFFILGSFAASMPTELKRLSERALSNPLISTEFSKQIKACEQAALQGDAPAQCALGFLYEEGCGGNEQNFQKAVEFYEKAAQQGDAPAQFYLGACYAEGRGVTKDLKKAAELFEKAAQQDFAPAQTRLKQLLANQETTSSSSSK